MVTKKDYLVYKYLSQKLLFVRGHPFKLKHMSYIKSHHLHTVLNRYCKNIKFYYIVKFDLPCSNYILLGVNNSYVL